jgi:hypoxanthine phosphoribosyltransferase
MAEKVFLDWEWVSHQLNTIADKLQGDNLDIYAVTGIPRGGLIPAIMFSHRYGIPYMDFSQAKNLPRVSRKKIIVLDDIADTGKTLEEILPLSFITATLAYRDMSSIAPDYFGEHIEHGDWLVYPWEEKNSKTVQDYLVI